MSVFAKVGLKFGRSVTHVEKRAEPELLCKPRPMTGILALLTSEQRKRALDYKGHESHGPDQGFRLAN